MRLCVKVYANYVQYQHTTIRITRIQNALYGETCKRLSHDFNGLMYGIFKISVLKIFNNVPKRTPTFKVLPYQYGCF